MAASSRERTLCLTNEWMWRAAMGQVGSAALFSARQLRSADLGSSHQPGRHVWRTACGLPGGQRAQACLPPPLAAPLPRLARFPALALAGCSCRRVHRMRVPMGRLPPPPALPLLPHARPHVRWLCNRHTRARFFKRPWRGGQC